MNTKFLVSNFQTGGAKVKYSATKSSDQTSCSTAELANLSFQNLKIKEGEDFISGLPNSQKYADTVELKRSNFKNYLRKNLGP